MGDNERGDDSRGEVAGDTSRWLIHYAADSDASRPPSAQAFLDGLAPQVAAEIHAVVDLVAASGQPMKPIGRRWSALQADLEGIWCVRVNYGKLNYRLWCVLEEAADDLGGPSIVCLTGASKPLHSQTPSTVLGRVAALRDHFAASRKVVDPPSY